MQLQELLPLLSGFDKIIVTGPQRSGTTVATKIIATELAYEYVYESAFEVDDLNKFADVLQKKRIVVQAPGMSSVAHLFAKSNGVAVVFMWRPTSDITASERRINWTDDFRNAELAKYFMPSDTSIPVSEAKMRYWELYQKDALAKNGFVLDYESMSLHPLWVQQDERGAGIQPDNMGTKTLVEQTVARLRYKLEQPVVRMSIGAGLHYKLEPEEESNRQSRLPSRTWINHDGCAHGGIDIVGPWDNLPLPDACIDYLELGDVVEHVPMYDHDRIYAEWFRLVKPGGRVHISTPNIHRAMVEYTAQVISVDNLQGHVRIEIVRDGERKSKIINVPALPANMTPLQLALQQIYAWGHTPYEYHYYTYTVDTLRAMLEKHGFEQIDFSESPGVDGNSDKSMAWWLCVTAVKKLSK